MALRITRRTFVGRLVRSASATAAGILLVGPPAHTRTALASPAPESAGGSRAVPARREVSDGDAPVGALRVVVDGDTPVSVRMADLVLAGRDLRSGLSDGVRLPSQGGDAPGLAAERPDATYITPALQSEFPCTHVGVHWRTDGGDQGGLRVALRSSRDGQTWTSWRSVSRESHGPDRTGVSAEPETFGALLGGRLATWLQVRLTFEQATPETATVSALTLTCLDSRRDGEPTPRGRGASRPDELRAGRGVMDRALGDEVVLKAGSTSFLDRVITREAWGADESLRFKDGVNQWPAAYVTPSLLVVHHTASDGDIGDAEADVRAIYAYHAITQGWGDIGYNLLIDSSGRVYEGRSGREPDAAGRREIVSENVVAGHALDYNYGSVGIALLGNFQERRPGNAQIEALVEALAFMAQRYGIDVTSTQNYVRARGDQTTLWRDGLQNVSGHRDCIPTECPGDNVYTLLPEIRRRVDEQLGERGPAVRITRAPTDRNAWPGDLAFQWEDDPNTAEVSTRLAAFRRVVGSDRIEPLSGYVDDERPAWGPWTRERALSVPLPPDAKGIYTLLVRARDVAGREGRVVVRTAVSVDRHVIVDDVDALRTRREGVWDRSGAVLGYNGSGYQSAAPGQAAALFRWQLSVPEEGTYRLQATWTEAPDRSEQAVYRLSQGGKALGEETVNQQEPGGKWGQVLEASLVAGQPCIVELDGAADGVVIADAIRLVLAP